MLLPPPLQSAPLRQWLWSQRPTAMPCGAMVLHIDPEVPYGPITKEL